MKKNQLKIKIKTFFSRNIISALLLALFPAVIIIIIEPINFQKYKIELNSTQINNKRIDIYRDVDKNGSYEEYRLFNFTNAKLALMIFDKYMNNIYQYNSKYFMPFGCANPSVYFADINGDASEDVLFFSQYKDSVFLNIFSVKGFKPLVKDRFITKIGINGKQDYSYKWICAEDINNDKNKEIYFTINGWFSLYPRKLFRYDFKNDTLISTENSGSKQRVFNFLDDRGDLIFFSGTPETNNCPKDFQYKYPDTCAWIFGYDKNLKKLFNPIPIPGEFSHISNIYKVNNRYFMNSRTKKGDKKERNILFFDKKGRITDKINTGKESYTQILSLKIKNKNHFFLYKIKNEKYIFDEFNPAAKKIFSSEYSRQLKNLSCETNPNNNDIDNDLKPEFLFRDRANNNYYLYRNNLKNRVKIPIKENTRYIMSFSSATDKDNTKLIFTTKDYIYYCTYYKNPEYIWKYPFWILVYIVSFIFVRIIQIQQNKKIIKQTELKNRIVNLQLKNTQNQLDPHFTFNALNIVASKIYKEDKKTAYDLFERFSRLMRSSLAFSDKIFRPLSDELQFTEDYLEFQKTRFKNLFDFEINISENIDPDKIKIPKMIVQGFAENCVKHAFKGINYKGKIIITAEKQADKVLIKIEDNGIGIKQSQINNPVPESGVGMHAMQEQIALINKLYNKEITINIIDKSYQNYNSEGTIIFIGI